MPLPFAFIAYLHFALLLAVAVRLLSVQRGCGRVREAGGGRRGRLTARASNVSAVALAICILRPTEAK